MRTTEESLNAKLYNDVKFDSNIFKNIATRLLSSDRPLEKVESGNSSRRAKTSEDEGRLIFFK